MVYKSNSPSETAKIASTLAKKLKRGNVVCLNGELGVGKTAFTKGLCEALGVTEHVTSPTYTIINRYEAEVPVFHIDAYRIDDSDEMYEIGFEDCLTEGISVIEWSVMIEDLLPENRIEIEIRRDINVHEDYREINIKEQKA
ncbi:MAG: tRNA (adenosine(37)-N6)-threonylcarbamoyltransferase complex ATPase subunit type 1 TsaE [Eubacteriales bacterium]|nr:tRNA (adenosine(37)-N6)-threonylcarbamoyltransferase complex ATPase subunit type 1 TsaE [Eubacteriales bacterium]